MHYYACQGACLEARQENTRALHRHTCVLVQTIMHKAIENMSSAYTRAMPDVKCHRSFIYMHARKHVILNTCRVV